MVKESQKLGKKIASQRFKKVAIALGIFVLGVVLGAWGEKLLTGEEKNVFRQRQSEYQFINPLLDFTPPEETRRGFGLLRKSWKI